MSSSARIAAGIVALACVALAAWGVTRTARSGFDSLSAHSVRWELAAPCVASLVAFAIVYAYCWSMLLRALERRPISQLAAMRLFLVTWPGRYVPASLPYYAARLAAAPAVGARRSVVAASFVYEMLFGIASSGGVATVLLLAMSGGRIGGGAWAIAAVLAAGVCGAMLHPTVPRAAIVLAAKRSRRLAPLEEHLLPPAALLRIFAAYVAGACIVGGSFWLATMALGAEVSPLTAIAVYNLAGVAGMLAVAVPGGIGVREGVVVALLSGTVSPPVALAAAVLARLAGVIADLIPLAAIVLFDALRRAGPARQPAADPAPIVREAA